MIFKVIVYRRENINVAIRTMRLEKDEILRKKSREVDIIDDKIQTLIDDMIETMYKYNGVGLSAVQVGVLKRVVVIDIEDGEGARVFINPKITSTKITPNIIYNFFSFINLIVSFFKTFNILINLLYPPL